MASGFFIAPLIFILLVCFAVILYLALRLLSLGEQWPETPGKRKPYACGEDIQVWCR